MPKNLALVSASLSLSALFAASLVAQASHRPPVSVSPRIYVWAWERDEDLSYIDPSKIAVAYFAGNIYVQGSNVRFRPRTQKLKLPVSARTIPVFRIESVRSGKSPPDVSAAAFVAKTIAAHIEKKAPAEMIQIDFDALADERGFYKALLSELRNSLPGDVKISITALASWLLSDKWLEPGSADETVAMLFSIGPGRNEVLSRIKKQPLNTGADIPVAIGISASEGYTNKILFQTAVQKRSDSLYIFSSRPWTEQRLRAITKEALAR